MGSTRAWGHSVLRPSEIQQRRQAQQTEIEALSVFSTVHLANSVKLLENIVDTLFPSVESLITSSAPADCPFLS